MYSFRRGRKFRIPHRWPWFSLEKFASVEKMIARITAAPVTTAQWLMRFCKDILSRRNYIGVVLMGAKWTGPIWGWISLSSVRRINLGLRVSSHPAHSSRAHRRGRRDASFEVYGIFTDFIVVGMLRLSSYLVDLAWLFLPVGSSHRGRCVWGAVCHRRCCCRPSICAVCLRSLFTAGVRSTTHFHLHLAHYLLRSLFRRVSHGSFLLNIPEKMK